MNPEQNYSGMYTQPQPQPQPTNNVGRGGQSQSKKIMIIVAGVMGGLIVFYLLFSLFFGGSSSKDQLTKVASTQQEIVRVSSIASESRSASRGTYSLASIAKASALTNLTDITGIITSQHGKIDNKLLKADQNEVIDTKLASADQSNSFNEEFAEVMVVLIQNAITAVNEAADSTSKDSTIQVLTSIQETNSQLLDFFSE